MRKFNKLSSSVLFFCTGLLVLTTVVASRQEQPSHKKQSKDLSRFPIVDFHTEEPRDPILRAKKEARGRKYGNKHMAPISERTDQVFSATDWEARLPALPVNQSDAVVRGTITGAEAHLTPDKTGIFSEFKIVIDLVLKNDAENPLDVGRTMNVERNGGRVRMPSGKIVVSWVKNQNMPRLGGRYVLFLTHTFESRGDAGKDFYILTGYELRDGQVFPMDDTLPGHPITAYTNTSESVFLNDLISAIANSSNTSK